VGYARIEPLTAALGQVKRSALGPGRPPPPPGERGAGIFLKKRGGDPKTGGGGF